MKQQLCLLDILQIRIYTRIRILGTVLGKGCVAEPAPAVDLLTIEFKSNTNTNTNNLFSNQQSIQLTTLYNIVSVKKNLL